MFSLFQHCAHTSACADKIAALEMFEQMQKEEGLESEAEAGMYSLTTLGVSIHSSFYSFLKEDRVDEL